MKIESRDTFYRLFFPALLIIRCLRMLTTAALHNSFRRPRVRVIIQRHTIRVGHGAAYSSYADLPRGKHVVIGGSESGMDVAHFLVGLGDEVTVIDPSAPWGRRESDSSYGLSPYTFDRVVELKASGKVTFVDERAETITATTVTTKSHTIEVAHPAIDATGFDISKSLAGQLFEFDDEGMPNITENDESYGKQYPTSISSTRGRPDGVAPHQCSSESAASCLIYADVCNSW